MSSFSFSVTPANLARFYDLLLCLSRFDENVSWEASQEHICLSALNLSKTAFASFKLSKSNFFSDYQFSPALTSGYAVGRTSAEKVQCRFLNKSLLAVFRRRTNELRDKDTAIERCDVALRGKDDDTKCRLIVKMICRHGVIKTFRLTYEAVEILRANFDPNTSPNYWTIQSRTIKDIVEYFGPKTEQLDWYYDQGKVVFTSYTEKISDGRQVLKQPLHTSVAIERKDFDDFSVQEGLHIGIVVKDFKAIVAHADTLHTGITARYAQANRPMQLTYQSDGMLCEYTLMTRGHSTGVPNQGNTRTPVRDLSVRPSPAPQPSPGQGEAGNRTIGSMAPPPKETAGKKTLSNPLEPRAAQPSPPPAPSASLNHDSLFMPAEDDERQWDAQEYGDDDAGEHLFWDQTQDFGTNNGRRIRDSEPSTEFLPFQGNQEETAIAPTQRLSAVRGLFD